MLLTSSQVSAIISSGIVIIFTSILFASGLVLQRQSVRNLNAVLHPPGERKGPWEKLVQRAEWALQSQDPSSYDFEETLNEGVESAAEAETEAPSEEATGWSRRAYVQIVQKPEEICNAIMGVASLSVQGSPARRVLIVPDDGGRDGGEFWSSPHTDLIEIAKREHLLETINMQGISTASPVEQLQGLSDFHELLYLQPNGMIINASRLDQAFGTQPDEASTGLGHNGVRDSAVLVRPLLLSDRQAAEDLKMPNFSTKSSSEGLLAFAENLDSVRRSRSLDSAYIQGQLLGDVGYIHLDGVTAGRIGAASAAGLGRRGGATISGQVQRTEPLVELVMERYEIERDTICGHYPAAVTEDL